VIDLRNRDAAVPSAFCRCGGQKRSSSGNRGASTTTEVPTTMHNEALTRNRQIELGRSIKDRPDRAHALNAGYKFLSGQCSWCQYYMNALLTWLSNSSCLLRQIYCQYNLLYKFACFPWPTQRCYCKGMRWSAMCHTITVQSTCTQHKWGSILVLVDPSGLFQLSTTSILEGILRNSEFATN
jgi:hypothetical protein